MRAGSLQNLMADEAIDAAKPEIGTGATIVSWTDRHAGTVIEVSATGHKIVVQEDTAIRTDSNGMSDAQAYRFERDTAGRLIEATRRKDGSYRVKGGTQRVLIGTRSRYHDFGF
jgi:YD repeat-containing protein